MLIVIRRFVDNTQILLEAHYYILQHSLCIHNETFPRHQKLLSYFTLFAINHYFLITSQFTLQLITVCIMLRMCRLIVEQVHMVTSGTSYYNSIHSMMTVIYSFLVYALQIFRIGNNVSLAVCRRIILCLRQSIHTLKTRQHNVIPYIIHSPISLQSCRNAPIA